MSRLVSRDEIKEIERMMERAGIPVHVWLPIMHLESSGNVLAHNPRGEDSRGLFQINLQAGPGGAWTPDFVRRLNLFDPIENARAILSEHWLGNRDRIKRMLGFISPADQAAYMYQRSIRPKWTSELEGRIRHFSTDGLDSLKRRYGLTGVIEDDGDEEIVRENIIDERRDEEGAPSWILSPFARLAWEWERAWPRVLIVLFGIPIFVISVLFLLFKPEKIASTALKLKTGGVVDLEDIGKESEGE